MTRRVSFLVGVRVWPESEVQIKERLHAHLVRLRTRRLEVKLAALSEPSHTWTDEEINAEAASVVAGKPPHVELAYRDIDRIARRAGRLAKARARASGLPGTLKTEDRERLFAAAPGLRLAGPASEHEADELVAGLLAEMPWMNDALAHVWQDARQAAAQGEGLHVSPLLLLGPPGVGKSHLAQRLAQAAGVPLALIDLGTGTEGFRVAGLTRGWGSAHPGPPVETMLTTGVANPIVFVDETEKGGTLHSGKDGTPTSAWNALLGLLEPSTAKRWTCPYHSVPMDMSRVTWVLAANSLGALPAPLLSRLRVVHVPVLSPCDLAHVARREAERLGLGAEAAEALAAVVEAKGAGLDLRAVLRLARNLAHREAMPLMH